MAVAQSSRVLISFDDRHVDKWYRWNEITEKMHKISWVIHRAYLLSYSSVALFLFLKIVYQYCLNNNISTSNSFCHCFFVCSGYCCPVCYKFFGFRNMPSVDFLESLENKSLCYATMLSQSIYSYSTFLCYNLCGPDTVGAQNFVRSGQVSG
uniref:Uncharacterized protein n=1 Tax=Strigamia maritima TaxID=126957 RepID=T1JNI6_STRMM